VTIQDPTQVTSCRLVAPVRHLFSNNRSARMGLSHMQRVFLVENYQKFRSYLTCQNKFRVTLPDSSVPNKSTVFRMVNSFHGGRNCSPAGTVHETRGKGSANACIHRWTPWTFPTLDITFFSDFSVIYFLTRKCTGDGWLFDHPV
jgi:hypothetical protein